MKRLLILFYALIVSTTALSRDFTDAEIDSLSRIFYSLPDSDPQKLSISLRLSHYHYNVDSVIAWADRVLPLAVIHNNAKAVADVYSYKSWAYYYKDDFNESNSFSYKALVIADSLNNDTLRMAIFKDIALNYAVFKDFEKSNMYYMKSLELAYKLRDTSVIAYLYYALGYDYNDQKMYSKAEEMFQKCLQLDSASVGHEIRSYVLDGLGNTYMYQYSDDGDTSNFVLLARAKALYRESVDCCIEIFPIASLCKVMYLEAVNNGYSRSARMSVADSISGLCDLGYAEVERNDYYSAPFYLDMSMVYCNILRGDFQAARAGVDSLEVHISENPDAESGTKRDYYFMLAQYYKALGDYKSAMLYTVRYYDEVNNSVSIGVAVQSTQSLAQAEYDIATRMRDEREENERRLRSYMLIAFLILIFMGCWDYIRKRRHNQELNLKNAQLVCQREEIKSQKEELQAQSDEMAQKNEQITLKNRMITDSISYASLIQKAVLPRADMMDGMFEGFFLIYRPLDIVTGDFYWAAQYNGRKVLACADCTGHGVPGAFLSMLGITLLGDIVPAVLANGGNAADILNMLRDRFMQSLGQSRYLYEEKDGCNTDGIDMSLVIVDEGCEKLQYAGANRPLWIWRDGELLRFAPDKMPVGLYLGEERDFRNNDIEIAKGCMIYMFSDGITDQFGFRDEADGKAKRFSTMRLANMLSEIGGKDTDEQRRLIEEAVDEWKNGYKQMDDNILIGVRI